MMDWSLIDFLIALGVWFVMSFVISFGVARFIRIGKGPWRDDDEN
tara:strand:- start:1286 stop:1420 length:135 start_codon:yes stop_codon:yes gene_type:complete